MLQEGGHAGLVAQRDRVVGLGLEHLGERDLRFLELALLEKGATEAVAGLDVVGSGLDDLGVELDRASPVALEGRRRGLVGHGPDAKTLVGSRHH